MPIELIQGSDTLNQGRIKINQAFSAQTNIWSSGTGSYSIVANNYTNNAAFGNKAFCIGKGNFSYGNFSSIFGGYNNSVSNTLGVIVGGSQNSAGGKCSFIGAGDSNYIFKDYGIIVGGSFNMVNGQFSTIVGGQANYINGKVNFIGAGRSNLTYKPGFYFTADVHSSIGGGYFNKTYGTKCVIGGGQYNFVK